MIWFLYIMIHLITCSHISGYALYHVVLYQGRKGMLGAYAMKREAEGAHLATACFFSLRNAQMAYPTTRWAAVTSLVQASGTSFLRLSELGRALWPNVDEDSAE